MRRRKNRLGLDSDIKTSSTGDIAFLLIIFFMVTATFAVTKGLEFELPDSDMSGRDTGDPSVLVEIARDGSIRVDCRPMEVNEILEYLAPRLTANPGKPVIVYANDAAEYRHMIRVYDTLYQAPDHGMPAPNIQIPTPRIIEQYTETFGVNPFENHCNG